MVPVRIKKIYNDSGHPLTKLFREIYSERLTGINFSITLTKNPKIFMVVMKK